MFGTECFVHVPKVRRKKWDAKSVKGVMIGYSGQKDSYLVWIPGTNTVYQSHDVIFKDEVIVSSRAEIVMLSHKSQEDKSVGTDVHDNIIAVDMPVSAGEPSSVVQSGAASGSETHRLHDRSTLKKPPQHEGHVTAATTAEAFTVITGEPTTYREAMLSQDSSKWREAMNEEMSSLQESNVWKLMQLPHNRKAIDNRWLVGCSMLNSQVLE